MMLPATTRRDVMKMVAVGLLGLAGGCSPLRVGVTLPGSRADDAFLQDLQRRTFDWFWDTTNPLNGLVPDRWPTKSFSSIAAVGFGLTAYPIGVERGWISREQARDRTLATLRFFANAPMGPEAAGRTGYKGFFYHFIDMENGRRFETTELSSIDTTLLLGGVLFAAQYFDRPDVAEAEIRRLAARLNDAVDWRWMLGRGPFVSMGWKPESGFIPSQWDRYNEATLLYLLALGSPTFAISPEIWTRYTRNFDLSWGDHWGQRHLHFPPLFGHQFSHVWVDFKGIADPWLRGKGIDLFENSRRATIAQRNYAIANPGRWRGYDGEVWGLTACDGPGDFKVTIDSRKREFFSYSARGPDGRDDGTLAPAAAAGSIAFAPELVLPALAAMRARYGAAIYGRYGFFDSFNPTLAHPALAGLIHEGGIVPGVAWVSDDYLGIDQGSIVAMIANHHDGLIWRRMRGSAPIVAGLRRAGFTGGWLRA